MKEVSVQMEFGSNIGGREWARAGYEWEEMWEEEMEPE